MNGFIRFLCPFCLPLLGETESYVEKGFFMGQNSNLMGSLLEKLIFTTKHQDNW